MDAVVAPIVYPGKFSSNLCCLRPPRLEKAEAEIYPVRLRKAMPSISIPLRETDREVALDLQQLLERCQRHGHYSDDIDYNVDLDPPLDAADAAWADELLRAAGRRPPKSA